jgi:hypothetical protein
MRILSLITVATFTFALAHADPPGHAEKIRKEYRGLAAPDHLMFAMHVRSMKETAEWNRDIAIGMVQKYMKLESEEAADAFLSRMTAAVGELESEYDAVWDQTVCRPDAPRSKEALYQMLDRVDDLTEIKNHNVFVKFMSSLHMRQQEAMTAWLKDSKEGFYYRTAEHKSLYEFSGEDVVERVETICAMRERQ